LRISSKSTILSIEAIDVPPSTNCSSLLVDCTRWLFRQHEASEFTPPLETLTASQKLNQDKGFKTEAVNLGNGSGYARRAKETAEETE
jgi:hypothetical protein